MRSTVHSLAEKTLACLVIAAVISSGCVVAEAPDPVPGLPEFHAFGVVTVPGGLYDVAGSNLVVRRTDLSVDTRILAGTAITATWNSATTRWHWSYEMQFDGATFVDGDGAVYDVATLPDGSAIPGTHWVRVDADTVKTKGGLAYDFDPRGRLDAVYWTSDPYPRYRFVHDPDFVEQRECVLASQLVQDCRLVLSALLGPDGPTRIVDEQSAEVGASRESRYGYDALGRLKTARTPSEVDQGLPGTRYEYASGGLLTAIVDSEGSRIEYRWAFARLLQVTRKGGGDPSHAFTYPQIVDQEDSLYSVIHANPLGGQTRYTFTKGGHVTQVERLDAGEIMTIDWLPALNRPSRIVGFDGTLLRLEDWVDDDPTRLIEPSGNEVRIGYAPDAVDVESPLARPLASISDSLGPVLRVNHDAEGRPVSVENGMGEATTLDYVGAEVSRATAPWGSTVDFLSYGVHGHWRTAEISSAPETKIQRRFDRVGNLLVPGAGLQEGGVLERTYDPTRMLSSLEVGATDESGAVVATGRVQASRRSDGRLLTVTRPYGADHAFEYDALGRLSRVRERVDGDWQDTTWSYDAAGNPTAIDRPNGMREELDYDLYGRTVERRTLRGGVVESFALFEWADDRLARWYDSVRDQWEIHEYDGAGRVRSITYSAFGERLSFDYDLRSRITRKSFQLGGASRVIEIEWDPADRRTRVFTRDGGGGEQDLVRLDYQQGRLAAIDYGNGLRRENLYDAATERFSGYRTTDLVSGALVEQTTITREPKVGPSRLEVTSRTETPIATTQEQYWLGLGGNLQSPSSKIGSRVFRWQAWTWIQGVLQDEDQQAYAWDELSNRVDDAEGDVLIYNAERNRLLAATVNGVSHTYSYDEAGFATSRDGMPITWTAAGRLATLGPDTDPLVEIEWDLAGRPVSVTALGATRELALFGGRVEYDAATGRTGWLHLAHVSLPFAGDERIYRHIDALGNLGFTSDETGAVTSQRRYHPFGLDRVYGGASFSEDDPHGFVGGIELRHDGVETGLVMLGARVLDSDVGRFLSQDPVFQWVNAYTYALGNPISYQDAGGQQQSPKSSTPSSEVVAAALDTIAGYFYVSAAGIGAVAGLRAVQGKEVEAAIGFAAAGVAGTLGAGFSFAGAVVRFVGIASQSQRPRPQAPPTLAPKPPKPPAQTKKLDFDIDTTVVASPPPCVAYPAGRATASDRWSWVMMGWMVSMYLSKGKRRRSVAWEAGNA